MADKRSGTLRTTQAAPAKKRQPMGKDSGVGTSASSRYDTPASSSRASSSSTIANSEVRLAKLNEQDFEKIVLNPRGVGIDDSTKSTLAFFHFGTDETPAEGLFDYYRNLPGLSETTLWLDGNESFLADVVREYDSMSEYGVNEAEYAVFAMEKLLKREIRNPRLLETRHWMAERMIQLVAKLEKLWEQPPVVDETVPREDYAFDIRPDCSYWVSLQAFNPEYRKTAGEFVSVRQKRILCPYLSIEFKKDESTLKQARVQVAVASAIALYNRYKLKKDRLDAFKRPWSDRQVEVLKHYGLTFTGRDYEFWCTEPNLGSEGSWKGCRMYRLAQNACDTPTGVRKFVNWINEIHRWGLTVHGPSCESDVKHCLASTPGAERTSLGAEGEEPYIQSEDEAERMGSTSGDRGKSAT